MSKMRMVQKYRDEAVKAAAKLTHDSYKAIKHMNKIQLVAFMTQVSQNGFKAGYEAAKKEFAPAEEPTPERVAEPAADPGGDAVEND